MKALKIIFVAVIVIVGLLLIVAAFLPDNVKLESSISINAQDNVIFNQVNNLENWEKWTPFTSDDMSHEYTGAAYGIGAMNTWKSAKMGNGNMEIIESVPFSNITTLLEFRKNGKANGYWAFEKTEEGTNVNWAVHMTDFSYPMGRLFGLMAGPMMQPSFEKGLVQLKEACEAMGDYSGVIVEEVDVTPAFSVIDSCTVDGISEMMGKSYGMIMKYLVKNGQEMTGMPYAVYHKWNPEGYCLIEAGIPADNSIGGNDEVIASSLRAGKVVKLMHKGSYDNLFETHDKIAKYINECGYEMGGSPYEIYVKDPMTVEDPSQYETLICYPIL